MKRHEHGYWLTPGGHTFDEKLAAGIAAILRDACATTVMDIGCGDGSYTRYFQAAGFTCKGYDGNPNTPPPCEVIDFAVPVWLHQSDAVLCLEVGEHIPAEFEDTFLDNVTDHAKKIAILSWAVPGQGGYGHVNERENGWVIFQMALRGFDIDPVLTDQLRQSVSNAHWFKDTVMVFHATA